MLEEVLTYRGVQFLNPRLKICITTRKSRYVYFFPQNGSVATPRIIFKVLLRGPFSDSRRPRSRFWGCKWDSKENFGALKIGPPCT